MTNPSLARLSLAGIACGLLLLLPYGEAGHTPAMQLLAGSLLAAGAGILLFGRLRLGPILPTLAGVLVLLAVAAVSFLRAPAPYVSFLAFVELAFLGCALWLGIEAGKGGEGIRRALFLGFGAYTLLYGWAAAGHALFRGALGSRLAAGLLDPNHLAAWLLLGAAALLADARLPSLRLLGAAAFVVPLALTRSLSGMLAAGGLLIAWVFARIGRRAGWALVLLFVAVWVPLGLWARARGADPYAWDRWLIWKAAAPAALESPLLGIGPGMFAVRQDAWNFPSPHGPFRTARRIGTPHSEPLGLAIELGLLGILAAILVLVLLGRDLRRGGPGRLAAGCLLAVPVGISALFSMTLHAPAVGLTLALLLGLLAGSSPDVGTAAGPAPVRRPHAWALAGMGWVFLVWCGIVAPYLGWRSLQRATGTADPVECIREAARSRAWNPWDAAAYRVPASVLLSTPSLDPRLYYSASRLVDEALARNPLDAASWVVRGRLEARAHIELFGDPGSRAAFREAFSRARDLMPWNPLLPDEEARWSLRLGEEDAALALLDQALEREPLFLGALHLRVRIWEARLGRAPDGSPERDGIGVALAHARAELGAAEALARGIEPRDDYERILLDPDAGEVPLGGGTLLESRSP